jgi:hypothetical protein
LSPAVGTSELTSKRSVKDRAAEQANYAAWKILAGADLLEGMT